MIPVDTAWNNFIKSESGTGIPCADKEESVSAHFS